MVGNLPCRQAGRQNDRCQDTEAQGALGRSRSFMQFFLSRRCDGESAEGVRQVGRGQTMKSLLISLPFIQQRPSSECLLCARLGYALGLEQGQDRHSLALVELPF